MARRDSTLVRATLDLCLLALIDAGDSYGYELVAALKAEGFPVVSEGSVYPVLRRLEEEGLIEGYLQTSTGGPARKYYRITEEGAGTLRAWASRTFEFLEIARGIITSRI